VFENRMHRRIFGLKSEDATKELQNEELQNLYSFVRYSWVEQINRMG
jgi:hypothetical protein